LTLVAALLSGLKAGVFAIVVQALLRIARRSLHTRALQALAALAFVGIFFFAVPFPLIIIAAGLFGLAWQSSAVVRLSAAGADESESALGIEAHYSSASRIPPSGARLLRTLALWIGLWAGPLLLVAGLLGADHILAVMALFFSKTALVTFGGAYSVLAYIAGRAVESYAWLSAGEMLDGLGLAETTPGPLIMVVQFVGFLGAFRNAAPFDPWLAGLLASIVVVWATFAPCFLWIFAGAPYMELLRRNMRLRAALSAITAAVSGVILNLTLWFAIRIAFTRQIEVNVFPLNFALPDPSSADPFMLSLMLVGCVLAFRFRLGLATTLAVCMTLGALRALGGALL
jgi:chromate transporter